jgi:hypothetical protein
MNQQKYYCFCADYVVRNSRVQQAVLILDAELVVKRTQHLALQTTTHRTLSWGYMI